MQINYTERIDKLDSKILVLENRFLLQEDLVNSHLKVLELFITFEAAFKFNNINLNEEK
jgi:hypothetical protein